MSFFQIESLLIETAVVASTALTTIEVLRRKAEILRRKPGK
jgi:hypothetical protein